MSDTNIEAIVAAQTAPRVTEEGIKELIDHVHYHILPNSTLTICVITMKNGFSFTGESACASAENFNQEVGEHYAYQDAFKKIWSHEAYLLKERMRWKDVLGLF